MRKFNPIQIRWKEPLGKPECPYAYRWVINLYFFAIRLHHFIRSDDKRHMHDHGWSFITMVISGSYTDVSSAGRDVLKRYSIRYRPAEHKHYVDVAPGGCWTVLITGPMKENGDFG